eukprot:scaffold5135_cov113-Isochrysis_galbana.AAC.3
MIFGKCDRPHVLPSLLYIARRQPGAQTYNPEIPRYGWAYPEHLGRWPVAETCRAGRLPVGVFRGPV